MSEAGPAVEFELDLARPAPPSVEVLELRRQLATAGGSVLHGQPRMDYDAW
jgi:hypothetical protein